MAATPASPVSSRPRATPTWDDPRTALFREGHRILAKPEYADIKPAGVLYSAPLHTYLNKKWADLVPKLAEAYKEAKAVEAKK